MKQKISNRYLVLDGYNLFHRARGGFQKGDWPVPFNFFRGLRPLIAQFLPLTRVYIVLEGNPKRHVALLPQYKANRPAAPDDFRRQIEKMVKILGMMPISVVQHDDFEADDVIAALIDHGQPGDVWTVVSSDSDFTQLLQRKTTGLIVDVYNWREGRYLEAPAYDYIVWKALRGDATDNIPRCPGMTENVAMQVVNDPNRLQVLMNDASFCASFKRNIELIELKTMDDSERAGITMTSPKSCDWNSVRSEFESMGFRSMLKESTWSKWTKTFDSIEDLYNDTTQT